MWGLHIFSLPLLLFRVGGVTTFAKRVMKALKSISIFRINYSFIFGGKNVVNTMKRIFNVDLRSISILHNTHPLVTIK